MPVIPFELILFGLTLVGVAVFHRHTLLVALVGLAAITGYRLATGGFETGAGTSGLLTHLGHEWVVLANLFLLLTGFALLARQVEASGLPDAVPNILPDSWTGGLVLLFLIFALSAVLDNIAAALIGGTIARHVFRDRVHPAYLVAIVAAANGGGAGSPIGDTTTTMMWLAGVSPARLVEAAVGAATAMLVFGIPAAITQQRHAPIVVDAPRGLAVDWTRVAMVGVILTVAIGTNIFASVAFPTAAREYPLLGLAVWAALIVTAMIRRPDWSVVPAAAKGAIFLLALVVAASMMPVRALPRASASTTFGLGLVSSVFDNIPLTALALRQGGYDWGLLAFAVGFGGSLMWFGSSAGVAIANLYPEARSVRGWVRHGWTVVVAYVAGFGAMLLLLG